MMAVQGPSQIVELVLIFFLISFIIIINWSS